MKVSLFAFLHDRVFLALERLDEWFHKHGIDGFGAWRICRIVGRMEPAYYDRHTDWENPLYVNPATNPEMYLKFAESLCAHGYRDSERCPTCVT